MPRLSVALVALALLAAPGRAQTPSPELPRVRLTAGDSAVYIGRLIAIDSAHVELLRSSDGSSWSIPRGSVTRVEVPREVVSPSRRLPFGALAGMLVGAASVATWNEIQRHRPQARDLPGRGKLPDVPLWHGVVAGLVVGTSAAALWSGERWRVVPLASLE